MIKEALEQVSSERIRNHIKELEGVRHPVSNPEALEAAADYIHATLKALDYTMSEHLFLDDDEEFRNIIGTHKGTQYPEEYVLVLAHYDSEIDTPGANDNASGIAAMLEVARVLRPLRFARSIQFVAVNLEENKPGVAGQITRGSRALALDARENERNIKGVINFEEIAYASDDHPQRAPEGLPIEFPDAGNFIAVIGNEASGEMVKGFVAAIEKYQIALPCFPLVIPGNGEALPDTRRSDHAPFWDQGYQAIMVTDTADFRTPHYHQTTDTLDTLNLEFAANVCRAGAGLAADMAELTSD